MPKKGQRRGKKRGSKPALPMSPPALPPMFRGSTVLRYQKTGSANALVVWRSLCALWAVAASSVSAVPPFDAVKLTKIVCRCQGVVNTGSPTASPILSLTIGSAPLDANSTSSTFALDRTYSDLPTSTRGAMISFTPPRGSNYDQWLNVQNLLGTASSPKLFNLQGPIGTIVDVHISYQLGFSSSGSYATVTGTGMTVNRTYLNFLDSMDTAGSVGGGILQCQSGGIGNTTFILN